MSLKPRQRKSLVKRLLASQGMFCCYCEILMEPAPVPGEPRHPRAMTLEHLQRRTEGGSNRIDNMALACHECNCNRGSLDWLTYKSYKMNEL